MVKETFRFIISVVLFCLVLIGIAALGGCSKDDFTYVGCLARDNTRNPCQ